MTDRATRPDTEASVIATLPESPDDFVLLADVDPDYDRDCDDLAEAEEDHMLVCEFGGPRPEIVVLCGSTRFKEEFARVNADLTLAGKLVISLGVFGQVDMPDLDWSTGGSETKIALDELHKRKIDLADRVLIIDVDGYVGESTRSEIEYATVAGKCVEYLSRM